MVKLTPNLKYADMKRFFILISIITFGIFSGCKSDEVNFPDFDYSAVYFAYQSPVRILVLGDDKVFDNTLDNQHKFNIMATLAGVYTNNNNIIIDVGVDNSLVSNLKFETPTGKEVMALPAEYYNLPSNMQIEIPRGKMMGGLQIELTDAFFADPASFTTNYVVPLVMQNVTGADTILSGRTAVGVERGIANRTNPNHWSVSPKDYTLYAIRYINPWHANYLRRGKEVVNGTTEYIYRENFVERDQVVSAVTRSRNEVAIRLNATGANRINIPFDMLLTFTDGQNCVITSINATATIAGTGKFVSDGDEWGDKKRNVLHLQYKVEFAGSAHEFTDTLVVRDRNVKLETFLPVYVNP
jgi:hypothetical protein